MPIYLACKWGAEPPFNLTITQLSAKKVLRFTIRNSFLSRKENWGTVKQ